MYTINHSNHLAMVYNTLSRAASHAVLLHCGPVLTIFIIAKGQLVQSILYRKHCTVLPSIGAATSLTCQDLPFSYRTVRDGNHDYIATWFRSIATQLSHCLAGSFSFQCRCHCWFICPFQGSLLLLHERGICDSSSMCTCPNQQHPSWRCFN